MSRVDRDRQLLDVVRTMGHHPVLMDIGASGEVPHPWAPIAPESIYVGFDPDPRELSGSASDRFRARHILRAAVVPEGGGDQATIFLTKSPFCSSTLEPDHRALSSYLFAELFSVERTAPAPAITIPQAMLRLGLDRIHWFKTDSQGTDLRLYRSIPAPVRDRVLAVDVEPGLIDAYVGEDLFVDAHAHLARSGYWLSNLRVGGAVRMRQATLRELGALDGAALERAVRPSPGWCEARYLRTLDALAGPAFDRPDWQLAWVFAMVDRQWGFALDIAHEYARRFDADAVQRTMTEVALGVVRAAARGPLWRSAARTVIPSRLRRFARAAFQRKPGTRW